MTVTGVDLPERWAPIPGARACYEVSTFGRVRSWHAMTSWPSDEHPAGRPRLLVASPNDCGYLKVSLGRGLQLYVHRAVIEAHVGPPPSPDEWTVDHIDFDQRNNRLANLRYLTLEENSARHAPAELVVLRGHGRRKARKLRAA